MHIFVIDCQEKLFPFIQNNEELLQQLLFFTKAIELLSLPITIFEQYPKGLGRTIEPLRRPDVVTKTTFACTPFPVEAKEAMHIVLTGIETHICIYQTALELLSAGKKVTVIADCVGSRREIDHLLALQDLSQHSVEISTAERLVYQLLKTSQHPMFRPIVELIKKRSS